MEVTMPTSSDNIMLKVCPRCSSTHSRNDSNCGHCASMAKAIREKLPDLRMRWRMGEDLSEGERKTLKSLTGFLDKAGLSEEQFLDQDPFPLPDELQGVHPSFSNRLIFFMDRMGQEGRKVESTRAATIFLNKVKEFVSGKKGTMNSRDFVDFALKHGVKPVMHADSEMLFAAWNHDDVMELWNQYRAEISAKEEIGEDKPEGLLSSLQAAVVAGVPSAGAFANLAKEYGVRPAKSFGDMPEQMAWHREDAETLGRMWKLDAEIDKGEERLAGLDRAIERLDQPPVKWPAMQKIRELSKERDQVRELVRQLNEKRARGLMARPHQSEEQLPGPKTASDRRLARILALA
jgi:hypothetical protein